MQDSEIKLARCGRCSAYVWIGEVSGCRTAVDPAPLASTEHVFATLGAARAVYEVVQRVGRPHHLKWLGGHNRNWDPAGRMLVGAHGCGAGATASVAVEVPPEGPQKAPATPGRPSGGFPHRPAPGSGSQGRTANLDLHQGSSGHPSPAIHATHHPSDQGEHQWNGAAPNAARTSATGTPPPRSAHASATSAGSSSATRHVSPRFVPVARVLKCDACKKAVKPGEDYVAIEHYRFTWAQHAFDCVHEETTQSWRPIMGSTHVSTARDPGYDINWQLMRSEKHYASPIEDVIKTL